MKRLRVCKGRQSALAPGQPCDTVPSIRPRSQQCRARTSGGTQPNPQSPLRLRPSPPRICRRRRRHRRRFAFSGRGVYRYSARRIAALTAEHWQLGLRPDGGERALCVGAVNRPDGGPQRLGDGSHAAGGGEPVGRQHQVLLAAGRHRDIPGRATDARRPTAAPPRRRRRPPARPASRAAVGPGVEERSPQPTWRRSLPPG
jgi:hypothetical protein